MKNYTTCLLLLVSVYFSFSVFSQKKDESKQPNNAYNLFKSKGDANYINGDYLKAIAYYNYCKTKIDNSERESLSQLIQNSQDLFKLREEATTAFLKKDYQTAKSICQKILKINPDVTTKKLLEGIESDINTKYDSFLESFIKKGDERLKEGKLEEATAFYRVITKSNEDYRKVYVTAQLKKIQDIIIYPPDCKPQFNEFLKLANLQYGESQFKKSVKNYIQAKNLHCTSNIKWIDDAIFYCNRSIYLLELIDDLQNSNDESNINRVLDAYQKLMYKYAPHSKGLKKDFYEYCKRRFLKNPCGGKSAEYSSIMKSLDESLFNIDGIQTLLDSCIKIPPTKGKDTTIIVKNCTEQFRELEKIKSEIKESELNIESGNYTLAEKRLYVADKKIKILDCISKKDSTELPERIYSLLEEIAKKNSQKVCREKSQEYLLQADSLYAKRNCKKSFELLQNITVSCLNKIDSVKYSTLYTRVRCCINDTLFIQYMKLNQAKYLDSTRLSYDIRESTDVCFYIKEAVKFTCTKEDSLKLEIQYKDCRCKNFKENCPPPIIKDIKISNKCDTATKFKVRFEFFIGGSLGTFKPTYPLAVLTDDGYNTTFDLGKRFGVRINLMSYKKILDLRIGLNSESFYYTVKDSKLTFPSTVSSMSVLNGSLDFKFHTLPSCPSRIRYYIAPGILVSKYSTSTLKIPFLEDYTNRTFNDKLYGGFSLALGLEKAKGSGKYGYSLELFYNQLGTLYSKESNSFLKPWDSKTAQINYIGIHVGAFLF